MKINEIFGFGKKAQMRRGAMNLANNIMVKQIIVPALAQFKGVFEGVDIKEDKGDYLLTGYNFIVYLNVSDDYVEPITRDDHTTYYLADGLEDKVENAIYQNYKKWRASADETHALMITEPNVLTTFGANYKHSSGHYEQSIEIRFRIMDGGINKKFESTDNLNEIFSSLGSAIYHDAANKQAEKQRKDAEAKKKKPGPITSDTLADINAKLGNTKKTNEQTELEETYEGNEFYEAYGDLWFNEDEQLDEAEYQGRKVPLGKPMRGDVKKFKVYVKNPKGNVVKVNFGDPDMRIKKSNPARRRSFRARHNCDNPGPRTKARYWSCRKW